MAEREMDDVGSTGDGLGDGSEMQEGREGAKVEPSRLGGRKASDPGSTAQSEGTIESGATDGDLSQASGGSVD